MAGFSSELSGSLIFNSASTSAALLPFSGGINVSGSELFINGVGLDTRIGTIEAGFVSSASLYPLNQHSASVNLFTASLNLFTGSTEASISSINTFTSSVNTRVTSLESNDSNYITLSDLPAGTVSSSQQITDLGYLTSASAADLGFGEGGGITIPAGTISSSQQINDLGYITSSDSSISSSYSSFAVTSSVATTASYVSATNIDGTVSNATSASYSVTASYINPTFISQSAAAAGFTNVSIPAGTVSSSQQISDLGYITSSGGDTTALNTFTASYYVDSASFASRIDNVTGSSDNTSLNTFTSSYYVDSASFDSRISAISAGDTSYDGDRVISNEDLGDLYTNSFNAGTTGSIQDFLNAVFFPNTAPTLTSGTNYESIEFATSGSTALTLTATDAEGQSVTFAAASSYTAGLVVVESDGTVKYAVVPTEAAFNTVNRGDGILAHPVDIEITDTFGSTTSTTVYINVVTNSTPVFRQTSVGGSIITSFTANRNENASAGEVGKIYFTDANSDAITIRSSSDANGHFSLTKYSTYVQINQVTSSLDYETITSYTMAITASDEHYEAAQDTDASSSLVITINVTDNLAPTINNQTLTSINEDSSGGTTVDTIAASDNEGDTRTFFDFTLSKLELDNVDVPTGSYGGTSQATDPTENPFQMNSSGVVTRKAGVYLNSDIINEYQYTVKVKDSYNITSNTATVTIPIADDPAPSISTNGTFYVIESATNGDPVKINSNGYTGTQARVTSNEVVTWSTNSSLIQVNGTGYISLNSDVSGSYTNGQTFSAGITASNSFGTITQNDYTFNVTENKAPVLVLTDLGLNTDTAISGSNIASVTISDQETNTPYSVTLSGADAGSFNLVSQNEANSSLYIQPTASLSAGTYNITASATDTFSKTGSGSLAIEVSTAADVGKVYVYDVGFFDGTYNNNLGIVSADSSTPPVATSYSGYGFIEKIEDGYLGSGSFTYSWGSTRTANLLVSGSDGSSIGDVLTNLSTISRTNSNTFVILAPSGSDLTIPSSMTNGYGGSTLGEYVLEAATDGTALGSGLGTTEGSNIHKINLGSAHLGFSSWVMIGPQNQITGTTSLLLDVRPSSGSGPS